VVAAIALELHRRDHGRYAGTLAELSPRYMPVVPTDPFDGRALRYRVLQGKPLVYSIGADGDDDGGRTPERGNSIAGPLSPWLFRARNLRSAEETPSEYDGDFVVYPMPETAAAKRVGPTMPSR